MLQKEKKLKELLRQQKVLGAKVTALDNDIKAVAENKPEEKVDRGEPAIDTTQPSVEIPSGITEEKVEPVNPMEETSSDDLDTWLNQ